MKRIQGLLMGVMAMAVAGLAQAGENYHVVKVKNWDKDVEFEVMADSDFQKVLAEQQKQAKCASKAADLAKDAWQSDESTRGKPFPQKALMLPIYTKVGTFSKKEQADERCSRSFEKQREDKAAEAKAAKGKKTKVDPREAESLARQREARKIFETKLIEVMTPASKPPEGGGEAVPEAK